MYTLGLRHQNPHPSPFTLHPSPRNPHPATLAQDLTELAAQLTPGLFTLSSQVERYLSRLRREASKPIGLVCMPPSHLPLIASILLDPCASPLPIPRPSTVHQTSPTRAACLSTLALRATSALTALSRCPLCIPHLTLLASRTHSMTRMTAFVFPGRRA